LDEFVAAVVPNSVIEAMVSRLKASGVKDVLVYGTEAEGLAHVQSLRSVMFRLSEESS
jgi:hypothetical protein